MELASMTSKDQAHQLREMVREKYDQANEELKNNRIGKQQVFAIASGKGGVGKTNLSVNLGISLAKKNKKVLVMDADLGLSNVQVILGEIPPYNLYHVLQGEKTLTEVVFHTKSGIDIIAGSNGFSQLANLSGEERFRFIEQLEVLKTYDIIIIDTGAGVSKNVTSFLLAADKVIIITTPQPTSVTDAYGIIKVLATQNKKIQINLVVNRGQTVIQARDVSQRISKIARQYLGIEINNLGMVFEDKTVEEALFKRIPFIVLNPKSKSSIAVESIGAKLLNLPDVTKSDGNWMIKLFGKIFN